MGDLIFTYEGDFSFVALENDEIRNGKRLTLSEGDSLLAKIDFSGLLLTGEEIDEAGESNIYLHIDFSAWNGTDSTIQRYKKVAISPQFEPTKVTVNFNAAIAANFFPVYLSPYGRLVVGITTTFENKYQMVIPVKIINRRIFKSLPKDIEIVDA